MSRALVPLAEGCEELEAVTIIDLLRRAGIEVVTCGLASGPVTGSRGTRLLPDRSLDESLDEEFDLVALPGGIPGSDHLADDPRIGELLKKMSRSKRLVAAVCAAPKALARNGLLEGARATAFPGVLEAERHPEITGSAVTRDGNVITARSVGTAMDFALELIEALEGPEKRQEIETSLHR